MPVNPLEIQKSHKCRQANARELRPLCDTKFEASNADVSNLFKHITEQDQDLILGENHEDDHSFLEKNIAYFADRGYDTLLLEGVHYETQSMLDAWFKSSESTPPLELKLLLGSKLSLVTKAKAARIRVVGIDSEQTYIV
ncbi:MAG TPA: hypothetical protein VK832_20620, partial [Burkholderiaceae bacterium]|nr:hypothetical protein [Burkholderiaceae bacterium]